MGEERTMIEEIGFEVESFVYTPKLDQTPLILAPEGSLYPCSKKLV
jgi:hypothetical protein